MSSSSTSDAASTSTIPDSSSSNNEFLDKLEQLYQYVKTVHSVETITPSNIITIATELAHIVQKYKTLSGFQKKTLVVAVIKRCINDGVEDESTRNILLVIADTTLPIAIDTIISAINGKLKFSKGDLSKPSSGKSSTSSSTSSSINFGDILSKMFVLCKCNKNSTLDENVETSETTPDASTTPVVTPLAIEEKKDDIVLSNETVLDANEVETAPLNIMVSSTLNLDDVIESVLAIESKTEEPVNDVFTTEESTTSSVISESVESVVVTPEQTTTTTTTETITNL